jgi:hypothetical protein
MTLGASFALGATATFLPLGSTTVPPGTDVKFDVVLSVATISAFDAADMVIGSHQATDVSLAFSAEWDAAFANVIMVSDPLGFYPQDVFASGNNTVSVGASLKLGTITLNTTGLGEGTYNVMISSAIDRDNSKLSRGDLRDLLSGAATFDIECIAADADCDGDFDLPDFGGLRSCLLGPGQGVSPQCQRYDTDADGDVDMMDAGTHLLGFTGAR